MQGFNPLKIPPEKIPPKDGTLEFRTSIGNLLDKNLDRIMIFDIPVEKCRFTLLRDCDFYLKFIHYDPEIGTRIAKVDAAKIKREDGKLFFALTWSKEESYLYLGTKEGLFYDKAQKAEFEKFSVMSWVKVDERGNSCVSNVLDIVGDISKVMSLPDEEVSTLIEVDLPFYIPIENEPVEMRLDDLTISFQIDKIYLTENDFNYLNHGELVAGGEKIGIYQNTRGRLPFSRASIKIPKRIVDPFKIVDDNAVGLDIDYEKAKIYGPPTSDVKNLLLKIVNNYIRVMKEEIRILGLEDIRYDDLLNFRVAYIHKEEIIADVLYAVTRDESNRIIGGFPPFRYSDTLKDRFKRGEIEKTIEEPENPEYAVQISNEKDLFEFVKEAVDSGLKHPIQHRNWIEAFWDETTNTPKKEISIQPTIIEILKPYLNPYGISIVKESDEGIGRLDFKCIYNNNSKIMKVHIEFKLAHSDKWKNGLTKQLSAYMDADKTKYGIYLVFWFGDGIKFDKPKNIESIDILQEELDSEAKKIEDKIIEPIVIKVTKKKTASKR